MKKSTKGIISGVIIILAFIIYNIYFNPTTNIKYKVLNSEIYNVQGGFEGKFYINVEDDVTKISDSEYTKLAKSIYKRTNYKNIKGYNTLKTKNKNKPKKILIYVYEYIEDETNIYLSHPKIIIHYEGKEYITMVKDFQH